MLLGQLALEELKRRVRFGERRHRSPGGGGEGHQVVGGVVGQHRQDAHRPGAVRLAEVRHHPLPGREALGQGLLERLHRQARHRRRRDGLGTTHAQDGGRHG